ncbi:unnamed protein product [Rhizoctonia solani]|uniref:Tetratricopeptide repeat protein n=1 Tax=Rhizoctonia solani TaxID=456999 RepID=A0A8H2XMK0_9AGAM|nr:unnamed protein product [Rhizoctonia solani]
MSGPGRFSLWDDDEEEAPQDPAPQDPTPQDPTSQNPTPRSSVPEITIPDRCVSETPETETPDAETPVPGAFLFDAPAANPVIPPPIPEELSQGATPSRSNTPAQSVHLVPSGPSNTSNTPAVINELGDNVDPNSGQSVPEVPPEVRPMTLNGASTDSSQNASIATTPAVDEPNHLLDLIDASLPALALTPTPETHGQGQTPAALNPVSNFNNTTASSANVQPLIRTNPILASIIGQPGDSAREASLSSFYEPPAGANEMSPEERGAFAADAFLSTGNLEAARHAITDLRTALNVGADVPLAQKAQVAEMLSSVLSQRFDHYGDIDDMEQAVETQTRLAALSLEEGADPELRAKSHGGLGRTMAAQFSHTADPDDAELAITHLDQALRLTPPGHVDRPTVLADFARIELAQYARSDDHNYLEKALARCEEALNSIPQDTPERTPLSGLLGGALLSRFERTHSFEDIARAVEFLEFAVIHTPRGNPERPKRMRSYGDAIMMRAVGQNDFASLNAAIDVHGAALELLTPEHAAYPAVTGSLAKAFHARYRGTGNIQDLDRAIEHLKTTVEYTPFTDPDHARITDLLGKSFMTKYRTAVQPPRSQYLDYAITLHRQAVALTPREHRHYAGRLESLGKAYSKRYRSQLRRNSIQPNDLQQAERCLTEAMEREPSRAERILHELGKLNQ